MRIIRPEQPDNSGAVSSEREAVRVVPIEPGLDLFAKEEQIAPDGLGEAQHISSVKFVHPAACGHLIESAEQMVTCNLCNSAVCEECRITCAWCLRSLCHEHACRWDGEQFCPRCRVTYVARSAALGLVGCIAAFVRLIGRGVIQILAAIHRACSKEY